MKGTSETTFFRFGGDQCFLGRVLLVMILAFTAYSAHAIRDAHGSEPDTFEFDESLVEKWKESKTVIPPFPNEDDLLPVTGGATDTIKGYIDRRSISRLPDRVARFTLVLESASGTHNVYYEGLRCENRQHKTYAIGSSNRTFIPAKNPRWRTIPRPAINGFRDYIYRYYVCDKHNSARFPEEIVRLLERQP